MNLDDILGKVDKSFDWDKTKKLNFAKVFVTFVKVRAAYLDPKKRARIDLEFNRSIIIELFQFKPNIKFLIGDCEDQAVLLDVRKRESMHSRNELFFNTASAPFQEDFSEAVLFVFKNYVDKINNTFDFKLLTSSIDQLATELRDELISTHYVLDYFIKLKLEILDEEFPRFFDPYLKTNKWSIDDKVKLVQKLISEYRIALLEDRFINPVENFMVLGYRYKVSKATSDKYVLAIVSLLNDRLVAWDEPRIELTLNDKVDPRIETNSDENEIYSYFQKLRNKNKKGQEIMSEKEIRLFIGSAFVNCEYQKLENKLKPKTTQQALRKLVHGFYYEDRNTQANKQKEYCLLLINSFEQFKSYDRADGVDDLSKKLGNSVEGHYPF
ncbi:MAG: hypothetical protein ACI9J3_000032 [Parvicellaceae bacterium]|jgi:hypothetical protein